MSILVTSNSSLKLDAVQLYITKEMPHITTISGFSCDGCNLPPQPIHYEKKFSGTSDFPKQIRSGGYSSVFLFAKERINYAKKHCKEFDQYDFVVSIENGLRYHRDDFVNGLRYVGDGSLYDVCFVVIYHKHSKSFSNNVVNENHNLLQNVGVPDAAWNTLKNTNLEEYPHTLNVYGYSKTIGEILYEQSLYDPYSLKVDPKNWFPSYLPNLKLDRKDQIFDSVSNAFEQLRRNLHITSLLSDQFKSYSDFPKSGVLFQDFLPLFSKPKHVKTLVEYMKSQYDQLENIDVIVGLESRGFILGVPLAYAMELPFVAVRKAGKLPGSVHKVKYGTEYSTATCEIQQDSIKPGQRVLIVDDLIATGGSMQAAVKLIEMCGGIVADCCVLKNVPELKDQCDKHLKCSYKVLL